MAAAVYDVCALFYWACFRMHSLGIEPDSGLMWFAQLFGMRDHLAFPLCEYYPTAIHLCSMTLYTYTSKHTMHTYMSPASIHVCIVTSLTAQASLPAAKLLQYGDVEEGVAYLSRRVAENRHGINTPCGARERVMLGQEIRARMLRKG